MIPTQLHPGEQIRTKKPEIYDNRGDKVLPTGSIGTVKQVRQAGNEEPTVLVYDVIFPSNAWLIYTEADLADVELVA